MTSSMTRVLRIAFFVVLFTLPTLAFAEQPADAGFTPLTSIPGIEDAGNADTLPDFLNSLYKICIGLAAALAVLQIMRAGIMYMGGDSVTEKKDARKLIGMSIGGLILVLSPVIVFSVINPEILSLKIEGIKDLATKVTGGEGGSTTAISVPDAKTCTDAHGTVAGQAPNLICTLPSDSPLVTAANACTNFTNFTATSGTCEFAAGDTYVNVNTSCCAGIQAGYKCCAQSKSAPSTSVDIARSLAVVKYESIAGTGAGEDLGPTSATKASYESYTSLCSATGGVVRDSFSEKRRCTDAELAGFTGPASTKPYLWCVPDTISCLAHQGL